MRCKTEVFDAPFVQSNRMTANIHDTAIDKITKPLEVIKVQKAANLFQMHPWEIRRPYGRVDILVS